MRESSYMILHKYSCLQIKKVDNFKESICVENQKHNKAPKFTYYFMIITKILSAMWLDSYKAWTMINALKRLLSILAQIYIVSSDQTWRIIKKKY